MTPQEPIIDWPALREMLAAGSYGPQQLTIAGGRVAATDLVAFLDRWPWPAGPKRWEYWQHVSELVLTSGQSLDASQIGTLEMARLFGLGGDLSLRRDGNLFRWHFVGPAGIVLPVGATSFWSADRQTNFLRQEKRALLWGQRREWPGRDPLWLEDRIGWAALSYPGVPNGADGRAVVCYWTFGQGGQPAFVWLYQLAEALEVLDGHRQD